MNTLHRFWLHKVLFKILSTKVTRSVSLFTAGWGQTDQYFSFSFTNLSSQRAFKEFIWIIWINWASIWKLKKCCLKECTSQRDITREGVYGGQRPPLKKLVAPPIDQTYLSSCVPSTGISILISVPITTFLQVLIQSAQYSELILIPEPVPVSTHHSMCCS